MATVNLAVQEATRDGIDLTDNGSLSTGDTYKFPNDGRTLLHFKKTGAGACTVTMTTPGSVDGLAVADRTLTVPASTGDRHAGPWPVETYNDSSGMASFTVSEVTGLTVALVRI